MKKTLLLAGVCCMALGATGCTTRANNANSVTRAVTNNVTTSGNRKYIPGEEHVRGSERYNVSNRRNKKRVANSVTGVTNNMTRSTEHARNNHTTDRNDGNHRSQSNSNRLTEPMAREARNIEYGYGIGQHYTTDDNMQYGNNMTRNNHNNSYANDGNRNMTASSYANDGHRNTRSNSYANDGNMIQDYAHMPNYLD